MKTTGYFKYTKKRPDRARICDQWTEQVMQHPVAEKVQADGRVQRWSFIAEEQRYPRVVLLEDRETVHNAFFDRRFRPVEETRAISDNVYVDLDKDGNLVSMTIEHAGRHASLPRVSVEEIDV